MQPAPDDPSNLSSHQRLRELTAILANGIHRLRGVTAALDTADAAQQHGSHRDPRASLAPSRQGPAALKPSQVVVMDNLSAHKSPRVDQLVESVGARVLRLPPYSPDFNPIENAISKMKSLLRKLCRRSIDDLEAAICTALRAITAKDARGFFSPCGYNATNA